MKEIVRETLKGGIGAYMLGGATKQIVTFGTELSLFGWMAAGIIIGLGANLIYHSLKYSWDQCKGEEE